MFSVILVFQCRNYLKKEKRKQNHHHHHHAHIPVNPFPKHCRLSQYLPPMAAKKIKNKLTSLIKISSDEVKI